MLFIGRDGQGTKDEVGGWAFRELDVQVRTKDMTVVRSICEIRSFMKCILAGTAFSMDFTFRDI